VNKTAKLTSAIVAGILFSSTGFANSFSNAKMYWTAGYQFGNTNDGTHNAVKITKDGFESHATIGLDIAINKFAFIANIGPKDNNNFNNFFGFAAHSSIRGQDVAFYGYATDSKRDLTTNTDTNVGISTVGVTAATKLNHDPQTKVGLSVAKITGTNTQSTSADAVAASITHMFKFKQPFFVNVQAMIGHSTTGATEGESASIFGYHPVHNGKLVVGLRGTLSNQTFMGTRINNKAIILSIGNVPAHNLTDNNITYLR
jgi:hypothetical protein